MRKLQPDYLGICFSLLNVSYLFGSHMQLVSCFIVVWKQWQRGVILTGVSCLLKSNGYSEVFGAEPHEVTVCSFDGCLAKSPAVVLTNSIVQTVTYKERSSPVLYSKVFPHGNGP